MDNFFFFNFYSFFFFSSFSFSVDFSGNPFHSQFFLNSDYFHQWTGSYFLSIFLLTHLLFKMSVFIWKQKHERRTWNKLFQFLFMIFINKSAFDILEQIVSNLEFHYSPSFSNRRQLHADMNTMYLPLYFTINVTYITKHLMTHKSIKYL